MRYLDLTLPTPEENLSLDEALLDEAEAAGNDCRVGRSQRAPPDHADSWWGSLRSTHLTSETAAETECLRIWEPQQPLVVVGRSSCVTDEVHLDTCRQLGIPVLRRVSGGAAIVTGPGCLMYSLVLSLRRRPRLRTIDRVHHEVLQPIVAALAPHVPGLTLCGTSDLAIGDRKVSGNSVRVRREHLLYHGTLLYRFPLELIERCLRMPRRQPHYRGGREHGAFVMNLPISVEQLRQSIKNAWQAVEPCSGWPRELTTHWVAHRYARPEWNDLERMQE